MAVLLHCNTVGAGHGVSAVLDSIQLYSNTAEIQYSPLYSNPPQDALGRHTEAMVSMVIWVPGWVRVTSHT